MRTVSILVSNASDTAWSISAVTVSMVTVALGVVLLVGLARSGRGLSETTLVSPWWWSLIAAGSLLASEALVWYGHDGAQPLPAWVLVCRFAAFAATFCPTMALMGAKRPQNRDWKYVVFCLWLILTLPAGWAAVMRPGRFAIEPIWAVFLLALIFVGMCNYLFTKYWCSSLLYGAGQLALVVDYLPWTDHPTGAGPAATGWRALLAVTAFTTALAAARLVARRPLRDDIAPLDRLWFDFRNAFGAVWALRVAERTNAAAAMYNWNIELRWDGLQVQQLPDVDTAQDRIAVDDGREGLSPETARAVEYNLRNLLRRFVSQKWIDDRLKS